MKKGIQIEKFYSCNIFFIGKLYSNSIMKHQDKEDMQYSYVVKNSITVKRYLI